MGMITLNKKMPYVQVHCCLINTIESFTDQGDYISSSVLSNELHCPSITTFTINIQFHRSGFENSGIARWLERLTQDRMIPGSSPSHAERLLWGCSHISQILPLQQPSGLGDPFNRMVKCPSKEISGLMWPFAVRLLINFYFILEEQENEAKLLGEEGSELAENGESSYNAVSDPSASPGEEFESGEASSVGSEELRSSGDGAPVENLDSSSTQTEDTNASAPPQTEATMENVVPKTEATTKNPPPETEVTSEGTPSVTRTINGDTPSETAATKNVTPPETESFNTGTPPEMKTSGETTPPETEETNPSATPVETEVASPKTQTTESTSTETEGPSEGVPVDSIPTGGDDNLTDNTVSDETVLTETLPITDMKETENEASTDSVTSTGENSPDVSTETPVIESNPPQVISDDAGSEEVAVGEEGNAAGMKSDGNPIEDWMNEKNPEEEMMADEQPDTEGAYVCQVFLISWSSYLMGLPNPRLVGVGEAVILTKGARHDRDSLVSVASSALYHWAMPLSHFYTVYAVVHLILYNS